VFVGSFIGSPPMNFLRCKARNGTAFSDAFETQGPGGMDGTELLLGIRPENIRIGEGPLRGRVLVVEPLGSHALLTVQVGGESMKVVAPADTTVRADQELRLTPEPHKVRWMDAASGRALTAPH
jgi:multiple sugar transport system ATP-binding protein